MNYEPFFRKIAENLDLTETEFETIKNSYDAVGYCLINSDVLKNFRVDVFPQGSIRLGTVIKPLSKDDYDVDLVCELSNLRTFLSPKDVKMFVGNALAKSRYFSQLDREHGRCWTLNYNASPKYHIDILPGLLSENGKGIKATIKTKNGEYCWLPTNPKGFADWFLSISRKRIILDESGNVEKIKKYTDKSPLQRAIQLIKRHRDVFYRNNPDDGPASVIITALAGLSYNGEQTIESILKTNPIKWASHIKIKNGRFSIKIPSLPDDDYADKWNGEDPGAAERFFKWHSQLILDLDTLFKQTNFCDFIDISSKLFDKTSVDKISTTNKSIMDSLDNSFKNINLPMRIEDTHPLFNHAFPISATGHKFIPNGRTSIRIVGKIYNSYEDRMNDFNKVAEFKDGSSLLKKNLYLKFQASIYNQFNQFQILWQITNTGEEAASCKRGGFERSDANGTKLETTSYAGTHFVQAFVIDMSTGYCVAKSNILNVNIGASDD